MSLVLFDIDGTLVRNAGSHHKEALVEGIRAVTGLTTTLEGVSTSGMLDRDLIRAMLHAQGASKRRIRMAMRGVVEACQTAYGVHQSLDLRDRVCPGVLDVLNELKLRGAALGVVTGNLSQIGWRKLEFAGLRDYFAIGAFAEDGTTRARLGLIASRRARKAGLTNGAGTVTLIGDHTNDVRAAKANGFQSVGVATGVLPYEELKASSPDILVRDLTEINIGRLL